MNAKELTIRQVGDFCSNTLCSHCSIKERNEKSGLHNGCMESLRLPEVSNMMLKMIKGKRVYERYQSKS